MGAYAKSIAAIVVTVLSAILAATTGDGVVDAAEWVNVAILAVGACGVFAAPNTVAGPYIKSVIAGLTAALTILSSAILGGIDSTVVIQMVIAAAGAVGVFAVPNASVGKHAAA